MGRAGTHAGCTFAAFCGLRPCPRPASGPLRNLSSAYSSAQPSRLQPSARRDSSPLRRGLARRLVCMSFALARPQRRCL